MKTASKLTDKGADLEEILRAYFWHAGYFVARGVPFKVDGDDITDIDLWLYERPAAATRRRLIVDIKNKKSPKAAERIVWAKGLQAALSVDGAIVATTDSRPSTRKFSRALGVTLFDGEATSKLVNSNLLRRAEWLTSEEFNSAIKRVDERRRSADWRTQIGEARASLISGFGVNSVNMNLSVCAYFAQQATNAYPNSEEANISLRLLYSASAMAAISLDYVLADQAFRSADDRRRSIISAIRFGNSDGNHNSATVRAAIALAQTYADNGSAISKQIENGFFADANNIPAEIIGDHIAKISVTDALFNTARELEGASIHQVLRPFDGLSVDAKSLLGVFLDFNLVSREKVANAVTPIHRPEVAAMGDNLNKSSSEPRGDNASKEQSTELFTKS